MPISYCKETKKRLETGFTITPAAEYIGALALRSMLLELSAAPKPGLIDRFNSGSHEDMNYELFIMSTSSIAPYFIYNTQVGLEHKGEGERLLRKIRQIGLAAEKEMFRKTGGVNTQKGLVFLLGLTSGAAGYLIKENNITPLSLSNFIKKICKNIVKKELLPLKENIPEKMTSGERIYLKYGLKGIRGEAEEGFPVVLEKGLPALEEGLREGLNLNDASLHSLCHIMAHLNDTALLNRHNMEILKKVQKETNELSQRGGLLTEKGKNKWKALEKKYNSEKINPGGSADMLAVCLMFYFLKKERIELFNH